MPFGEEQIGDEAHPGVDHIQGKGIGVDGMGLLPGGEDGFCREGDCLYREKRVSLWKAE